MTGSISRTVRSLLCLNSANVVLSIIERTLGNWVAVLTILALLIGAGILDVSSKVEISILKPAYWVRRSDYDRYCASRMNNTLRAFTRDLFQNADFLEFDLPQPYYDSTNNATYDKLMTDGYSIYKYRNISIRDNPQDELLLRDSFVEVHNSRIVDTLASTADQKRGLASVYLHRAMWRERKNSPARQLTSDSLRQLCQKYPEFADSTPTFIPDGLYFSRRVYNVLSIDNNSESEVADIRIEVSKRLLEFGDDPLKIEAWTLTSSLVALERREGQSVSVTIDRIEPRTGIQFVISDWFGRIHSEDVYVTQSRLKSLNSGKLMNILWISMICCAVFSITYQIVNAFKVSKRKD